MKSRRATRVLIVALAAAAAIAVAGAIGMLDARSTIEGVVVDAANGEPVYGARVRAGGRLTVLHLSTHFALQSLSNQPHVVTVSAPGYADATANVSSDNARSLHIAMKGIAIPDLGGIIIWPSVGRDGLQVDVQLRDKSGRNIDHFPRVSLPGFVQVLENLGTAEKPEKGEVMFQGRIVERYKPAAPVSKLSYSVPLAEMERPRHPVNLCIVEFTLMAPGGAYSMTRSDVELPPAASQPGRSGT